MDIACVLMYVACNLLKDVDQYNGKLDTENWPWPNDLSIVLYAHNTIAEGRAMNPLLNLRASIYLPKQIQWAS